MSSGITRRSALQGAALTTAAAVAGIPAAAFAEEAAATDEAKAAFEAAAGPHRRRSRPPASWDAEADVVIVGSGRRRTALGHSPGRCRLLDHRP